MAQHPILPLLDKALQARAGLLAPPHETAVRLFNGFYEGAPDLVADLYGRTLLLHNYGNPPETTMPALTASVDFLRERLPWAQAMIVKTRQARDEEARRGMLVHGQAVDRRVREHGVWYAIDLQMNRDACFYMDTRNLRRWAIDHLAGKTVLNTFAYTGSLGVAALAGGASQVVHIDRNRTFLNVAKTSYSLNGFPINKADFQAGDFFTQIGAMKRASARFDCVFVDPPFFSATSKGRVDLENASARVINKVRPLINDGGYLASINNALFVSGLDYMRTLDELCADGYLSVEALIPVPPDFTGYTGTVVGKPPVDPTPFNHPTKIVVLRVKRKQ
ncbi:MAG: class I SAM-dependent methyltransferase [Chloroflexi bacterium]|nr:class I SAM-dependent methyltransferase [Chloroflexota bacterium]